MNEREAIPHLREIVVFLVAAGILVPALSRLRISPVLGYLLVGALIGPFGLGLLAEEYPWLSIATITDLDGVRALAELGVRQGVKRAVEVGHIGSAVHHRQVVRVHPGLLVAELCLDAVVERGSGQRIRDRDPDVILPPEAAPLRSRRRWQA